MSGELLTPTLADHRPRDWAGGRLPWRTASLVYPSILGGPVAATIVVVMNARRLRLPAAQVWLLAAVGLVAVAAGVALQAAGLPWIAVALLGFAVFAVARRLLRSPDRVHATFSPHTDPDDDYAPFVIPAVLAIAVAWAVHLGLVVTFAEGA